MRIIAALAATLVFTGCAKNVTRFTPAPITFATYKLEAGTIDVSGSSCTPATPPAPADFSPPGPTQVLVGYQDWRNTATDVGGPMCTSSKAKRWEGFVAFDMTPVVTDLATKGAHSTFSGTLRYRVQNTFRNPATPNRMDLCVARIEVAAAPPASGGLFALNGLTQAFPASGNPTLGALPIPTDVAIKGETYKAPATVTVQDPTAANFTTVSVDVSLALNDWLGTRPSTLTLAFMPTGPTLATLGITNNPPTPVPDTRRTAACRTYIDTMELTVNVGR